MQRTTWVVAAALFSLVKCGGVTSPYGGGGGGPVGQGTVGNIIFRSSLPDLTVIPRAATRNENGSLKRKSVTRRRVSS